MKSKINNAKSEHLRIHGRKNIQLRIAVKCSLRKKQEKLYIWT